jgi:lysophospholipid hydrolase
VRPVRGRRTQIYVVRSVSSVKTLEEAKTTPGVLYMRQPVTDYGTMEFGSYIKIEDVGYRFANECLDEWKKSGLLPTGFVSQHERHGESGRPKIASRMRRASI